MVSEPALFFETGKTYRQERPSGAWLTFRCFGATVVPEGAIGAGSLLAAGFQSASVTPDTWDLTLMTGDAWADGWTPAEEGGGCLCPHSQQPDGTLTRDGVLAVGCPVHDPDDGAGRGGGGG